MDPKTVTVAGMSRHSRPLCSFHKCLLPFVLFPLSSFKPFLSSLSPATLSSAFSSLDGKSLSTKSALGISFPPPTSMKGWNSQVLVPFRSSFSCSPLVEVSPIKSSVRESAIPTADSLTAHFIGETSGSPITYSAKQLLRHNLYSLRT